MVTLDPHVSGFHRPPILLLVSGTFDPLVSQEGPLIPAAIQGLLYQAGTSNQ